MAPFLQNPPPFADERLDPLRERADRTVDFVFRELQARQRPVPGEVRRDIERAQCLIRAQKDLDRTIERADGARILERNPLEGDDESRHVAARIRHVMAVPVERDGPAVRQDDLMTVIAAMARAHVARAHRGRDARETAAERSSPARNRLAHLADPLRPSFDGIATLAPIFDAPRSRSDRVKSRQPPRGTGGRLGPAGLIGREEDQRGARALDLLLKEESQLGHIRERLGDGERMLRPEPRTPDRLHGAIHVRPIRRVDLAYQGALSPRRPHGDFERAAAARMMLDDPELNVLDGPPVGGKHAPELLADRRRVEDLGKGGEPRIDDGCRWHGPRLRPRGREGPPPAPPQPCRPIREPVYARRASHAPARWRPDGRPDAAPDPRAPTPDRPLERLRPDHPTPPSTLGTAEPAAAARR